MYIQDIFLSIWNFAYRNDVQGGFFYNCYLNSVVYK